MSNTDPVAAARAVGQTAAQFAASPNKSERLNGGMWNRSEVEATTHDIANKLTGLGNDGDRRTFLKELESDPAVSGLLSDRSLRPGTGAERERLRTYINKARERVGMPPLASGAPPPAYAPPASGPHSKVLSQGDADQLTTRSQTALNQIRREYETLHTGDSPFAPRSLAPFRGPEFGFRPFFPRR